MMLHDLALFIPLHHDFIDRWDCEFISTDWREEDGKLVLDFRRIKGEL